MIKDTTIVYNFEQSNVIVTGGSTGIGAETVKQFLLAGANVYALSRSEQKLSILSDQINLLNIQSNFITAPLDVRNISEFKRFIDIERKNGVEFDILINSAGIYPNFKLSGIEEVHWDLIMDINLKSVFFNSQTFVNSLTKDRGGSIINIVSFASLLPSFGNGVYSASKAALANLIKSMASEWAPKAIRVNGINPGVIKTDMTKSVIEKNAENMLEKIALKRFGEPREVSNLILFLASKASSYITGEIINITGGKLITQNPQEAWVIE